MPSLQRKPQDFQDEEMQATVYSLVEARAGNGDRVWLHAEIRLHRHICCSALRQE